MDNGVRLIGEVVPHSRAIAIGFWLDVGSAKEPEERQGASHFIEHMLFKGTEKRSARAIAEELDTVGGELNAFSAKESTCYYCRVPADHGELAMDVLCDILVNSKLDQEEFKRERGVIIEELGMYKDTPDELIHDMFVQTIWSDHPLGWPILGSLKSLRRMKKEHLLQFMEENYTADNLVVSVAGKFDPDKIFPILEEKLSPLKSSGKTREKVAPPTVNPVFSSQHKKTEQAHFCLGFETVNHMDPKRYALNIVNASLGGAMSSRLFQRIREESGLVYSIYSYITTYRDAGLLTIYGGCAPKNLEKVLIMTCEELANLKKNGLKDDELYRSREHLKGNIVLGMEGISSRMNKLGRNELLFGRVVPVEELIRGLDRVNHDSILEISSLFSNGKMAFSAIGSMKKNQVANLYLKARELVGDKI